MDFKIEKGGGGYNDKELASARESFEDGTDGIKESEFKEVEPMYISVIPHAPEDVHHTEEFEARIIVIEYDENNEIIGIELL